MRRILSNILASATTIFMLAPVLAFGFASCSSDDDVDTTPVPATAEGTFTDPRDGNEYRWVRYGTLDWMAENYRYDIGNEDICMVYDGDAQKLDAKVYGRLYTYDAAREACPDGWRLPTDEDWQSLEIAMGMPAAAAARNDAWRGSVAKRMMAIYGTVTDINIQLAGWYFPHTNMGMSGCRYYGVYGAFWTATKDPGQDNCYFYRKFFYGKDGVFRSSTAPDMGFSVRYVRDAR